MWLKSPNYRVVWLTVKPTTKQYPTLSELFKNGLRLPRS